MKRLIWQGKSFQKTQARWPQERDFEGMAFPSSEQPGASAPQSLLGLRLGGKGMRRQTWFFPTSCWLQNSRT